MSKELVASKGRKTAAAATTFRAPALLSDGFVADLGSFLDICGTATGRATFYNSLEEQQAAETAAHRRVFEQDRLVYGLCLTLPGVTDRARAVAVPHLLAGQGGGDLLGVGEDARRAAEERVFAHIIESLTAPRMAKALDSLRSAGVNNARARRLALRAILAGKGIENRFVRYRRKLGPAIRHLIGKRMASIVAVLCAKDSKTWTERERGIFRQAVGRHARGVDEKVLKACLLHALDGRQPAPEARKATPMIAAVHEARADLSAGSRLPVEVLEGVRGNFHRRVDHAEVMRITAANLTAGQKLAMQRKAAEAGVEVEFDPNAHDAVRLYVYAFEMGMDAKIAEALDAKAAAAAEQLPFRFEKVGILVDASASMAGHNTQAMRPMAVCLATRDALARTAAKATVRVCGGSGDGRLEKPSGDTSLAEGLVDLLREEPEAVFVISDGYENAPSGRFADVMEQVRKIGIETPVFHLCPVAAAEAGGVRKLAEGIVDTLPVADPRGMVLPMLRAALAHEPPKVLDKIADYAAGAGFLAVAAPRAAVKEIKP